MKKSWKEITLDDYYKITNIITDPALEEIDRDVELFALFHDMSPEEAYNLPLPKFSKMMGDLRWVFKKPVPEMVASSYVINGKKYITLMNPLKMTTAQYIDYKQMVVGAEDHLHQLLSIFLIPEGKTYNEGYEITEVEDDILTYLPITKAMGLFAFFFAWSKSWMEVLKDYSTKMLKKAIRREKDPEKKRALQEQMELLTVTYGFHSLTE